MVIRLLESLAQEKKGLPSLWKRNGGLVETK